MIVTVVINKSWMSLRNAFGHFMLDETFMLK